MPKATFRIDEPARCALMALKTRVRDDAMTAGLLGTERNGFAVRIRDDGLALTIGYLCIEAEALWLTGATGKTAPACLVALDHESGLALVRPDFTIGSTLLEQGNPDDVGEERSLRVLNNTGNIALPVAIAAIGEFAGRWEYVIDRAIYTVPACDDWGGAALLDGDNRLLGVGSLFLELPASGGTTVYGNLFVPTSLIMPHIDDLCLHGERRTPPRPWLGWMVQEHEGAFSVVGIYPDGPAERAGVQLGDTVTAIDGRRFDSLGNLFRTVWSVGDAGAEIPVTLVRDGVRRHSRLESVDRNAFFQTRHIGPVN